MRSLTQHESIDYLVIGHIARDLTPEGERLGGTAAYAALTAFALGYKVGVVTSWGAEMPLGMMNLVSIANTPSEQSTTFENLYQSGNRIQILHTTANNLTWEHIPSPWQYPPIVHLGPIAQEVDPQLAKRFPNSLLGVTPQGWLRDWDSDGHVHYKAWHESSTVLEEAAATVISREDVAGHEEIIDTMAAVCPVFIVTEGANGARVYWHGDVRRFQAPFTEEIDPTGSGDIFATAFFIQFNKTRDPWVSARFANQLASYSVARTGLQGVPTKEEISNATIEVI
jgi:sugar/nucleoside kinase (ribokinase family)